MGGYRLTPRVRNTSWAAGLVHGDLNRLAGGDDFALVGDFVVEWEAFPADFAGFDFDLSGSDTLDGRAIVEFEVSNDDMGSDSGTPITFSKYPTRACSQYVA